MQLATDSSAFVAGRSSRPLPVQRLVLCSSFLAVAMQALATSKPSALLELCGALPALCECESRKTQTAPTFSVETAVHTLYPNAKHNRQNQGTL